MQPVKGMAAFKRILVPINFSETSDAAWRLACDLAGPETTLIAVNVTAPLYPDVVYANVGAALQEQRADNERRLAGSAVAPRSRAPVERHVRVGDPAHEIIAAAKETAADVIVVGLHARHGLDHLLSGGLVNRIVRDAPCHVLVAKYEDHR
jgi:universal stress protein A